MRQHGSSVSSFPYKHSRLHFFNRKGRPFPQTGLCRNLPPGKQACPSLHGKRFAKHDKILEAQQVKYYLFCFESIIIKKPINLIILFVNYKAQTDYSLLFLKYSNMLSAYTPTFSTQLENFSAEYPSAVPVRSFLSGPEECCLPSFSSPASACPAPRTIPTGPFPVD